VEDKTPRSTFLNVWPDVWYPHFVTVLVQVETMCVHGAWATSQAQWSF